MPTALALRDLTKGFDGFRKPGESLAAVDGLTLDVAEHEFLTLVGPSGSGKSTLIRLIAGLERATTGDIYIFGQNVNDVPARRRDVGLVLQERALFKHLSLADNIAYGLKIRRMPKRERRFRVDELVDLMGLDGLEDRKPAQLSDAQLARVALARALASRPRILLLDEPIVATDAGTGHSLKETIKTLQRKLGVPTIMVTRNTGAALELGDRIAVMSSGRIDQIDVAEVILEKPATEFVSRFIGRGCMTSGGLNGHRLGTIVGAPSGVALHPEHVNGDFGRLPTTSDNGHALGTLASHKFLGRTVQVHLRLESGRPLTVSAGGHETPVDKNGTGSVSHPHHR